MSAVLVVLTPAGAPIAVTFRSSAAADKFADEYPGEVVARAPIWPAAEALDYWKESAS